MFRHYHEAPDPAVLFYQRKLESGQKEIATIQSLTTDDSGAWRALFRVPGQAEFIMDQYNSETVQEAVENAVKAVPVVDPFEMLAFECQCGKSYKYEKPYKKHKRKCKA